MTEIKVIHTQDNLFDLGALTLEERESYFDQIAAENRTVPRHTINNFEILQNEFLTTRSREERPTLKELLLRKVIHISQGFASPFNTIVVPIIPNFNEVLKKGGAFPMRKMRKEITREDAVKVRFDEQIIAVTETGADYLAPSNEEVNIIGIIFNPICMMPEVIKDSKLQPITSIKLSDGVGDRIETGAYTYVEASKSCEDYFTPPDRRADIAGEIVDRATIFMCERNDIMRVLNDIFTYIITHDKYHRESGIFVHAQLDEALNGRKGATALLRGRLSTRNYTIESPKTPVEPRSDILDILETVHNGAFSTAFHGAVLADLDMRGFSNIYYNALARGKDSKVVTDNLSKYKERQGRIAFRAKIIAKLLTERNILNVYLALIEKKFGNTRLVEIEHEISKNPSITVSADNILKLLKPAEKKPIQLEFERRAKYLEEYLNNKCEHVHLYKTFRRARDDEQAQKSYRALKLFFKASTGMIQCNHCKFDIMCPHIREYTELTFADKRYDEIKSALTKYIDRSTSDQYYCKICGELISSLEAFGDVGPPRDPSVSMNEELKQFMWGEIAALTKYLQFGSLINMSQLITAIRDTCYPFIFEIEKQILKSKTNTAEEIKSKKRLFVIIYAFAYMIHLILSNKVRTGALTFKNFKMENSKTLIVDLIRHVLELIILSRNIIIRSIPGMTPNIIKNKLIEAYKSMQTTGSQIIAQTDEAENLLVTLMLDPVYKYLYLMNICDDAISGKKVSKSRSDPVDKLDYIMGAPIARLEKEQDVFSHVHIPKFTQWKVSNFDNIKPMHGFKTSHSGSSVWSTTQSGYNVRSFELFMERVKKRLYMEPMYIDVSAAASAASAASASASASAASATSAASADAMNVNFREPFKVYNEKFEVLRAREELLYQYKHMEDAKIYGRLAGVASRRWYDRGTTLGRVYDEDGKVHNWNIFIVDIGGVQSSVRQSDVAKQIESGAEFHGKILDKKCSVCNVLWSEVDKLDETRIRESLGARYTISNFFRFYENRCPVGALHEFVKSKCAKCGMKLGAHGENEEGIAYYRVHKDVYTRERTEFASDESVTVAPKPVKDVSAFSADYENWSFNFNVVLELAAKVKINHRLLGTLGAIEKQEYADVQSGAFLPPEADQRNDTRIYVLSAHVKNLLTEYNQVKFFHKLLKPSYELSRLIDNSGINKHKLADLGALLPDIFNDYNDRFAYIQRNKKPREIVDFVLQTFCEMCLKIWLDSDKQTEKIRHDFVDYFIKKTLRAEEMVTKPGQFNWSLLYGDKEKETKDTNFSADSEKEAVDVDDDDEVTAPFENNFDVEDCDDEDGNDVRVDDLGL